MKPEPMAEVPDLPDSARFAAIKALDRVASRVDDPSADLALLTACETATAWADLRRDVYARAAGRVELRAKSRRLIEEAARAGGASPSRARLLAAQAAVALPWTPASSAALDRAIAEHDALGVAFA